jgi:hypothetical protein
VTYLKLLGDKLIRRRLEKSLKMVKKWRCFKGTVISVTGRRFIRKKTL